MPQPPLLSQPLRELGKGLEPVTGYGLRAR